MTLPSELSLDSAFSYQCNRCSRCCHGKRIRLLPYDVVRLAAAKGTSTGEIIRDHTEDGVVLKWAYGSEACTFLGPEGCTVHSGRPAACRVYPLGHRAYVDGTEGYVALEPNPETEGIYGEDGTVRSFIDAQGVRPYLQAAQQYHALLSEIASVLDHAPPGAAIPQEGDEAVHIFDVDAKLASYCASKAVEEPIDPEERVQMHIFLIREEMDSLKRHLSGAPES